MKYTYRHKKFTAVFTDEGGYFSLTGDYDGGGGACGDKIAKIDPRFKLLSDMHLCDTNTGAPMHAKENAVYWVKTGNIELLMKHLRISPDEAKALMGSVLTAGAIGKKYGEEHKKAELERIAGFRNRIEEGTKPDGKKSVYDIANALQAINNELMVNEKYAQKPCNFQIRIMGSNAQMELEHIMKIKKHMLNALDNSEKAAQSLPNRHAVAEQLQAVETFVNKLAPGWKADAAEVVRQAEELHSEYTASRKRHADLDLNEDEDLDDDLDDLDEDENESFDWDLCDSPEKVKALSEWLQCDPDDITEDDPLFMAHGREYLVVDNDEADKLWNEDLESYIDDCLEIPESIEPYFDRDRWKEDARTDGRGHCLGRYDGVEHYVTVEYGDHKFVYFIYRQ